MLVTSGLSIIQTGLRTSLCGELYFLSHFCVTATGIFSVPHFVPASVVFPRFCYVAKWNGRFSFFVDGSCIS